VSASTGGMESHGTSTANAGEDKLWTARWFVGIDGASEAHEVCVLDRAGQVGERRQVKHAVADLPAFVDALLARAGGDATTVAVGIEVPRGALVELLVERGFAVSAITPQPMDRFRDRFTPAGAKDDRRDARVIGDSVRTDPQAFRQVRLDHPVIIQLREWSRIDEDLGVELTRLTESRAGPGLSQRSRAAGAVASGRRSVVLGAAAPGAHTRDATAPVATPSRPAAARSPHPAGHDDTGTGGGCSSLRCLRPRAWSTPWPHTSTSCCRAWK
jgi:hypothetical protein